jgi:hypothetical protein
VVMRHIQRAQTVAPKESGQVRVIGT